MGMIKSKKPSKVSSVDKDLRSQNVPVFTLPVAHFAHIIDFRSYVNATMSLYSIRNDSLVQRVAHYGIAGKFRRRKFHNFVENQAFRGFNFAICV